MSHTPLRRPWGWIGLPELAKEAFGGSKHPQSCINLIHFMFLCCGGLPVWGVLPAYGGRYSPTRPSCGVLGCPTEHQTPRTPIAMTTLI